MTEGYSSQDKCNKLPVSDAMLSIEGPSYALEFNHESTIAVSPSSTSRSEPRHLHWLILREIALSESGPPMMAEFGKMLIACASGQPAQASTHCTVSFPV